MTQYDNTNRGVLFENDRKETDNHPDLTGKLNVNGVEHYISAWWKDGRNGGQFLSISLGRPVDQQQQERPQPPARRGPPPSSGGYGNRRG